MNILFLSLMYVSLVWCSCSLIIKNEDDQRNIEVSSSCSSDDSDEFESKCVLVDTEENEDLTFDSYDILINPSRIPTTNTNSMNIPEDELVDGSLTTDMIQEFNDKFNESDKYISVMRMAVLNQLFRFSNNHQNESLNQHHLYNSVMNTEFKVSDQQRTGACSFFATNAVLRLDMNEKFDLPVDFELSAQHTVFYSILERCKVFFDKIIEDCREDSILATVFEHGFNLVSSWDSNIKLIEKYGIVPSSVYDKTVNSSNIYQLTSSLNSQLRQYGRIILDAYKAGEDSESLSIRVKSFMEAIYRNLSIGFGIPVKEFVWQFRDRVGKLFRYQVASPQEFYAKFVKPSMHPRITLSNYTQLKEGNRYMIKEDTIYSFDVTYKEYVNVSVKDLTKYALKTILTKRAVYISVKIEALDYLSNVFDQDLFDHMKLYGRDYFMDRNEMNRSHLKSYLHDMVIVGVDLEECDGDDGKENNIPNKWKIENSWGSDDSFKGYYSMSQKWFETFIVSVSVPIDLIEMEASVTVTVTGADDDADADGLLSVIRQKEPLYKESLWDGVDEDN